MPCSRKASRRPEINEQAVGLDEALALNFSSESFYRSVRGVHRDLQYVTQMVLQAF